MCFKCDILLLADVFEKFGNYSFKNYGLCPSHYLSALGLRWGAMLKWQKLSLNLFQILTCIYSFRKVQEVEFLYISTRYSKANSKYIKFYNSKEESKCITYLDMNNLYDYAISKFPPISGFKFIDPKEFYLNEYTSNSSKECVLEADLEYPNELPELCNDYFLIQDKIDIEREILSLYW